MNSEDTYRGWTAEKIQEAENSGKYIPSSVITDYKNGDTDQDRARERENNWN